MEWRRLRNDMVSIMVAAVVSATLVSACQGILDGARASTTTTGRNDSRPASTRAIAGTCTVRRWCRAGR